MRRVLFLMAAWLAGASFVMLLGVNVVAPDHSGRIAPITPTGEWNAATGIQGPDVYGANINPLTGLPVAHPMLMNHRPLIVKVSNWPPDIVRPQFGLNGADIVYEYVVEGGVTRFAAIFYGNEEPFVGPVRSMRLFDISLARAYDGMLVFSGAAIGTWDRLKQEDHADVRPQMLTADATLGTGHGCPPFCRYFTDERPLEHTMFVHTGELWKAAEEMAMGQAVTPRGMAFFAAKPPGGTPSTELLISYARTSVEWRYDAGRGVWLRWADGEPHMDAATGKQLFAANVVFLRTEHIEMDPGPLNYWGTSNWAVDIPMIGEGPIRLFRDGQMYEGMWHRPDKDAFPTFTDLEGNALLFRPGRTYFQVIAPWLADPEIDEN